MSTTKIGKKPVSQFFLDFDNNYFPLCCMLNLGITSFVISPEAAKEFQIPVVKRTKRVKTADITSGDITTK